MRIGLMTGTNFTKESTVAVLESELNDSVAAKCSSAWCAHTFGMDAITALAVLGSKFTTLELGTAVVPIGPRHPTALAQQAIVASQTCDGRFTLGIGLSHKLVIEDMLGLNYTQVARQMREYLEILNPLLRGENVSFNGKFYKVNCQLMVDRPVEQILIAALGPRMLQVAGELANGTITWMTGIKTLSKYIVPEITRAARNSTPRVVAALPMVVTHNASQVREKLGQRLEIYGQLPSYQAMLEREGVKHPQDIALVGDEVLLRQSLDDLAATGISDLLVDIPQIDEETRQRTLEFLASCQ